MNPACCVYNNVISESDSDKLTFVVFDALPLTAAVFEILELAPPRPTAAVKCY